MFRREISPIAALSWNGVTLYATIDVGVTHDSHGVPFNGAYPNGVETLISKNSNSAVTSVAPNGLGQSFVGLKGSEPIASGWSFVFNAQTGFDPYSLERADGPKSLVENNVTAIDSQSANGDSSRAGQLFNTVAYGLASGYLYTINLAPTAGVRVRF